jgi:outer membrane protein TolC
MKSESLRVLMLHPRQFASLVLALTCALLISSTVLAQTPAPPQQPTQQPTTQESPESPPIPPRSIGLTPGKVVRWTKHDAILAALENNVDIEFEKTNVRMAQWDLLEAQGVYDPMTRSGIRYASAARPNIFAFSGVDTDVASTVENTYAYNLGVEQYIEKTGGFYTVGFDSARLASNTNTLSLNYTPSLEFTITQPIFRDFKIDTRRNTIKVRRTALAISDAAYRQQVIAIITRVEQAYWDLYVAIENEKIARGALTLAEKQMSDNKQKVEVGTEAPIVITEAATSVEERRSQVFQAINGVAVAENALKALTVGGPNSDLWDARIEPISKFEVQNQDLPLEDAINLAKANRPEIRQLNLQKEVNQVNIAFYRNQAKPQINFVAGYTMFGVGGTPATSTGPNCEPFDVNGQPTCLDLAPMVRPDGTTFAGVIPTQFQPNQTSEARIASNFRGGYGTSLRNLFTNDFRSWNVGIQINFPLRNRIAKANLAQEREREKQTDLNIRRMLQNIEIEVRNAVQAVETARLRIESTGQQRAYAEKQFEAEQKRLQAGLGSVFLVLTRQNDLSNAQIAENNAKADYAREVANLQRILSITDSSNNIQIPDPKQP